MEEEGCILEAIFEDEDALEEVEDVEMVDVEEGEITEPMPHIDSEQNGGGSGRSESAGNQTSKSRKRRRRGQKKNKGKKNGGYRPEVADIDWFVLNTCKRLREKKSYMMYAAVNCLGISRLSDLVKEVDAIQSCGGQMIAELGRYRTGGGILWNILKTKEPMAYKEIMKKTKEFEKQFKQQNIRQTPRISKELSSQELVPPSGGPPSNGQVDNQQELQDQHEQSSTEQKQKSVHDRIRAPVSYDDLLGDDLKTDSAFSEKVTD